MLVTHVRAGRVGFGINHEMRDFVNGRKKNLDLVVCTRGSTEEPSGSAFRELVERYEIELIGTELGELKRLPEMVQVPVGSVHMALEAKACMTAHIKALPRLYDELNSSHAAIHGSADFAIAAGFAMVNLGATFVSPDRNKRKLGRKGPEISEHSQPNDTVRTVEKLKEIPRRTQSNAPGFDALGIVVVRMANDGTPVNVVVDPPAPQPSDPWHYEQMIRRMASLYASRFSSI